MNAFHRKISAAIVLATVVAGVTVTEGFVTAALACTYYASPTGTGNGQSASSPFKISNFWSLAKPDYTLCLLDGVYSDPINPPENLNGTAFARITIKSLNDGGARINGGGVRTPIQLKNNDYFLIEGMNAHNSVCAAVQLGTGADNNILRRVVAWDAHPTANCHVWQINNNSGNLLEDVAGFGLGRKTFQWFSSSGPFTIRRAWGRWEHWGNSGQIGPKMAFTPAYHSYNATYENVIGTWDESSMTQPLNQPWGPFGADHFGTVPGKNTCTNSRIIGSIAYTTSNDKFSNGAFFKHSQYIGCFEYKHIVAYATNQPSLKPVYLPNLDKSFSGPVPAGTLLYTNGTEIGGASSIGSDWTVSNRATGSTIKDVPNIWNGAGSKGARVCKRYQNGSLTATALWPWPMNQRIIDAMKTAGKSPVDVTKTMEAIFGPISGECRSDSMGMLGAPINLNVTD